MKIRRILIIVPLLILAAALVTGSVLLWRIFILAVLVLLLGYLWIRLSINGISGRVEKSTESCHAGEYINEETTIVNSSRIPTPLIEIQEETNLPNHYNEAVINLSSRKSHSWRSRVYCRHRGRYSLGSLTASMSDPFGFFTLRRNLSQPQEILVYPEIVELPFFQPLSGSEAKYLYNQWSITGSAPEVARVREYVGGDSLNRIHWKSTAHASKLMVKVFDPDRPRHIPQNKNVWIILNMQQASQLGQGEETTEEYSIVIAASLVKKYIEVGKPVGLMAEGDQPYYFPPQTGEQHLTQVMEALAMMRASGKIPVDRFLAQETERLEASSAVIVITPSGIEGITAPLRPVISRGATVIAMLLDSASFGGAMSAFKTASALSSAGAQVYVIRRGLELKRALDSRMLAPRPGHTGDVAQQWPVIEKN